MERKLAAIFSTDVQGYSRLMGNDEAATIQTLTAYRQVMAELIQQHRGRVVDAPGDNLLAEFPSVVEAVQCAITIQQELKTRNAELPVHRRMQFRIGINLGDVVVEGERLYGDGVNIAARLEGLAEAGGICIAGTVYDQIKTRLPLAYEDLGPQTVKNIAEPVRVYRVHLEPAVSVPPGLPQRPRLLARWQRELTIVGLLLLLLSAGMTVWQWPSHPPVPASIIPAEVTTALPLPDKPSIAVLPFTNMSGDPEQEYFSDGMTEDLITDLSKLSGLFVIARNSVFTYKGQAVKTEQVSRELGVHYVLEGSVRKVGDRVRITAQLVEAKTGYHRWAERYDRELQDIFAVQAEIAQKIVAALAVQLTVGEQERLQRKYTENLEAYDHFLRGHDSLWRSTEQANMQARQLFERALSLDPTFAAAYVALGWTYWLEWVFQWDVNPRTLERAFALAQRALTLDDSLPMAHRLLGNVYLWNKQHDQAVAAAERAIALDPNDAEGYATLGDILNFAGRPQEAIGMVHKGMRLNPHYPAWYLTGLGHAYYLVGLYPEAMIVLKRALIRDPESVPAHAYLAAVYSAAGREAEAGAEIAEVRRRLTGAPPRQHLPYKDPAVSRRLHDVWFTLRSQSTETVRSASGIHLPSGVHIVPPAPDLSPEVAAFSGIWEGKWQDILPGRLVVEKIDAEWARLIVARADDAAGSVPGGWERVAARVLPGGRLQWVHEPSQATFTFAMAEDHLSLDGARDEAGRVVRVRMQRVEP